MKFWLFSVLLVAGCARGAFAQGSAVLKMSGDVANPHLWTLANIQKVAPIQTIKTTLKGKPYTVRGVPLWALVSATAPRLDPKAKHSEARFIVLARGQDGYVASFALPDLMPDTGNEGVFVVWEIDGQPLPAKDGPLRLVVPRDRKPMRWVHNLTAIEIYDGKRLVVSSTKPR